MPRSLNGFEPFEFNFLDFELNGFDHNFLIGHFQGVLRRDLIEDSFLFEAD